jgi:predicted permease
MTLWSRIVNVLRGDRIHREIEEEFASHLEEAVRAGRDPSEARQAFGSPLRHSEQMRDLHVLPWLDSLRADAVFGWRQLKKRKTTSAAAVLSLGIAIGACTSAFRLIDAVLLRPLPVTHAERLYVLSREMPNFDGKPYSHDSWAHPDFRLMRAAAKGQAELIAVSYAERVDLTYRSDAEMEKAYLQYVSGWTFETFGLRPAVGRLLTESDDLTPRANAYAVLSGDYWARRFGSDPNVVGRTFHMGDNVYEIIGVVAGPFTGTEPGIVTDVFVPATMNPAVAREDASWHRTLAVVAPNVALEPLRQRLDATSRAFEAQRLGRRSGSALLSRFLNQTLRMEPAAAGVSGLQQSYRRALVVLAVLVGLVLLIACANVANLLTAQAAAREREMALRVSIGAGRSRLVQLMAVESGWLGLLSAATGAWLAWWSTPFIVQRINPPDNPARIVLPADFRVLGFGIGLTLFVTLLFGLAPALRASAMRPIRALRGSSAPHARRRLMSTLVTLQVAFCFLVIFLAGLFGATFERLSHRPIGFSTERLLAIDVIAQHPRPAYEWDQLARHLGEVGGVERVAAAGWALPGGNSWNGSVSINGAPLDETFVYFLPVSPGWLETMRLRLIDGRDFRADDTSPGSAIVNETFVRQFFHGSNPLGQFFSRGANRYQIVGVAADAPYRNVREPIPPVALFPLHARTADGLLQPSRQQTLLVRTAGNHPSVAGLLRHEVSAFGSEFRAGNIRTQEELVQAQTVRERLLALLALFFASVAVLLSGVGLYGVLDYAVVQRRREIGIRLAIGAQAGDIARRVTVEAFSMVVLGASVGLAAGITLARYVQPLLYGVKATETGMLLAPSVTILAAACLAALPSVIRAVRINPAEMLRADSRYGTGPMRSRDRKGAVDTASPAPSATAPLRSRLCRSQHGKLPHDRGAA